MSISFDEAIEFVCGMFQIPRLFDDQKQCIQAFFENKNVFFSAPTGYGKSLIFQSLPIIADLVNGYCISTATLPVVSPLKALMADQVNSLEKVGITAMVLNENFSIEDIISHGGEVVPSIIYCSPEVLGIFYLFLFLFFLFIYFFYLYFI